MAITVIGFFSKRSEATDAVTELTGSGFYRNDIDISYGYLTTKPGMTDSGVEDDKEHKGNAITRFFNSLFGDNSDDAKRYSSISHKADSIVTVHAGSREQAEEAANILDACGAMDIDEGSLVSDTYVDSMDMEANREPVAPVVKSGSLYPYAAERVPGYTNPAEKEIMVEDLSDEKVRDRELTDNEISDGELTDNKMRGAELTDDEKTEVKFSEKEIRYVELSDREKNNIEPGSLDLGESTGVGLTQEDLLAAGLSAEEIKSMEGIPDPVLQNKGRTKSRIFDRKIDEDLRLREEHERLHREG